MTNPIGAGTCNVAVNMLREERQILGRLAFQADKSLGEFMRDLIAKALTAESPTEAAALIEARRRRKAALLVAVMAAGIVHAILVPDDRDWARARRMARVRRAESELVEAV